MVSFMFSTLGSLIFWVIFFASSFVIGSILLKHLAPLTWEYIKTGNRPNSERWRSLKAEVFPMVIASISIYLLWPFILIGIVIWLSASKIVWPIVRKSIIATSSIIPDIEIKKQENKKEV